MGDIEWEVGHAGIFIELSELFQPSLIKVIYPERGGIQPISRQGYRYIPPFSDILRFLRVAR